LGGNSGSRDRVPKINSGYQFRDPSPGTKVFDRLYAKKDSSVPRNNSREPIANKDEP
jgi:hypothetical protein